MSFLGVEVSLPGRRWVGPTEAELRSAAALSQLTNLPAPVALILARAGVAGEAVESYLAPTLRDLLPNPSDLLDMDRATAVVLRHLAAGHRIAVFGDYDVDGAAASALLHDWLGAVGVVPTIYIPDRIDEGYGPNEAAMRDLAADHPLIICVDCGTLSHGPI